MPGRDDQAGDFVRVTLAVPDAFDQEALRTATAWRSAATGWWPTP
ncbi:hypothetical protein [Streptacidiphilus sp. EB129]